MSELFQQKCPKCKTYRYPKQFLNDKNRLLKTCTNCRRIAKKYRLKKKSLNLNLIVNLIAVS